MVSYPPQLWRLFVFKRKIVGIRSCFYFNDGDILWADLPKFVVKQGIQLNSLKIELCTCSIFLSLATLYSESTYCVFMYLYYCNTLALCF